MDYIIFQKINSLAGQWHWLDVAGIFCAEFLIWLMPIFTVLFYFLSSPQERLNYRRSFLRAILIIVVAYLISQLIGLIYFRERPYVAHPIVNQLVIVYSQKSFPSDHTTLAFALSFAIMKIDRKIGILFFIFACLIGIARVFGGVHYPLDILAGFLVAILSTCLVNRFMRR